MEARITALALPHTMALRQERPAAAGEGHVNTMSRSKRMAKCERCSGMTAVRVALPCGRLVTMCIPCSSLFARFLNKRIRELARRAASASPSEMLGSILKNGDSITRATARDSLPAHSDHVSPDRLSPDRLSEWRVNKGRVRVLDQLRGDLTTSDLLQPVSRATRVWPSVAVPLSPGGAGATWGSGLAPTAAVTVELPEASQEAGGGGVGGMRVGGQGLGLEEISKPADVSRVHVSRVPTSVMAPLIAQGGPSQRGSVAPRGRGQASSAFPIHPLVTRSSANMNASRASLTAGPARTKWQRAPI
jgi:hypothetical protein